MCVWRTVSEEKAEPPAGDSGRKAGGNNVVPPPLSCPVLCEGSSRAGEAAVCRGGGCVSVPGGCGSPLRVLLPPLLSPLLLRSAPELQPPLYQPLTPSQYVSRWRPMRDRCFNIGSALIYSSCRSAPFSSLLSLATLSRCFPASCPSAPILRRPPGTGAKPPLSPRPLSLITFYQKLILFVQFIDQPRWRRWAVCVCVAPLSVWPQRTLCWPACPSSEPASRCFTPRQVYFFIGTFFSVCVFLLLNLSPPPAVV